MKTIKWHANEEKIWIYSRPFEWVCDKRSVARSFLQHDPLTTLLVGLEALLVGSVDVAAVCTV
jgi:hypothetical protein